VKLKESKAVHTWQAPDRIQKSVSIGHPASPKVRGPGPLPAEGPGRCVEPRRPSGDLEGGSFTGDPEGYVQEDSGD